MLRDLKTKIFTDFNFSTEGGRIPEDIVLSSEMGDGGGMYSDSDSACSLQQLDINHGTMIYITTKLIQVVIEKSFVGEDGNMIEAGTKISMEERGRDISPGSTETTQTQPIEKGMTDDHGVSTYLPPLSSSSPASSSLQQHTHHSSEASSEPFLTDEEAIAKLMEEDLLNLATTNSSSSSGDSLHSHHTQDFSSPPHLRAPDQPKNMRLFDGGDDDDDDNVDDGLHFAMGGHVDNIMSQFLNPSAAASAKNRHGRVPLAALVPTRQTHPPRPQPQPPLTQKVAFEVPVMNEEVVENARAAGLSEQEIREMFDVEYAERLQADMISTDLESESEKGRSGGRFDINNVNYINSNNSNRFEDLTLDDEKRDEDKVDQLTHNMNSVSNSSLGGRYHHTEVDEDFMSREEERLIQEILATSLVGVNESPRREEEEEREREREMENERGIDRHADRSRDREESLHHRESQRVVSQPEVVIPSHAEHIPSNSNNSSSSSSNARFGVVGQPLKSSTAAKGGGGSSNSIQPVHGKRHARESRATPNNSNHGNNSTDILRNNHHNSANARSSMGSSSSLGGGVLSLEGRRMDVGESNSTSTSTSTSSDHGKKKGQSQSQTHSVGGTQRERDRGDALTNTGGRQRPHGRGMRVEPHLSSPTTSHKSGATHKANSNTAETSRASARHTPHSPPLSEVPSHHTHITRSMSADRDIGMNVDRGTERSGGASELNDSMDDEVMAWALKMSALETGSGSSSSAPSSSRIEGTSSSTLSSSTLSPIRSKKNHSRAAVPVRSSGRQSATTRAHSHSHFKTREAQTKAQSQSQLQAPLRSGTNTSTSTISASEKAEQLLQRLTAELSGQSGGTAASRATATTGAAGTSTASHMSRIGSRGGRGGAAARIGGCGAGGSVPSSASVVDRAGRDDGDDDVSAMDEDEQLAWALQQSLL